MTVGRFPAQLTPLSEDEALALIAGLTPEEAWWVLHHWPNWARSGQAPPPGDWHTWVIMAGRGFGKTLAGAQWIAQQVEQTARLKVALVGATLAEAREIMVEGQSGLLTVARHLIADWHPSRRLLEFKNGSQARLFSGNSPEAFRGPEHHVAWCDELAKWAKGGEQAWALMALGLRLGAHPRVVVTTTPRGGPLLQDLLGRATTVVTGGATYANPHLAPAFLDSVEETFGGTSSAAQEIEGRLIPGTPGALWDVDGLSASRVAAGGTLPPLARVVIGVDPPSGPGTCGIVACGIDGEGIGHVLADHSVTAAAPKRWARTVADAAAVHGAALSAGKPLVVVEINQGGAMVSEVLLTAQPDLHVRTVTASKSKSHRAEPVALLFEAGRVRLHGRFPDLEAQLMGLIAGGGYEGPGSSPDRADAMVWALTELLLGRKRAAPVVSGL